MSNEWFKEFVFEVCVDRKYCSDEILEAFKTTPIVLPAWDPMGALAKSCECYEERCEQLHTMFILIYFHLEE